MLELPYLLVPSIIVASLAAATAGFLARRMGFSTESQIVLMLVVAASLLFFGCSETYEDGNP